jgi:hypothetical protein
MTKKALPTCTPRWKTKFVLRLARLMGVPIELRHARSK